MKKIITAIVVSLGLAIVVAASTPAQAQYVQYCNSCCDRDYYGYPRVRCGLVAPWPCGSACACAGIAGSGFTCY